MTVVFLCFAFFDSHASLQQEQELQQATQICFANGKAIASPTNVNLDIHSAVVSTCR
jgi:hypothetical protein